MLQVSDVVVVRADLAVERSFPGLLQRNFSPTWLMAPIWFHVSCLQWVLAAFTSLVLGAVLSPCTAVCIVLLKPSFLNPFGNAP